LGGVSSGGPPTGNALGGIDRFKSYFSKHIVEVGLEYSFEPSRVRSVAANVLRTAGTVLRFPGE